MSSETCSMGLSRKGRPLKQLTTMPPHLRAGHAFHDLAECVAGHQQGEAGDQLPTNRFRQRPESARHLPCRLVGKVEGPDEASAIQRRSRNTESPNHGNRRDSWHIRFCKTDLTH